MFGQLENWKGHQDSSSRSFPRAQRELRKVGWLVTTVEHCRGGLCWVLCGTMSERGSLQIQGLVRTPLSFLHASPDTVLARVKGRGPVS